LAKVSLPPYVIESPDVLVIDAVRLVPLPPYRVEPLDVLAIRVTGTLPENPIAGLYTVETDGTVNLGAGYRSVYVAGMTVEEARGTIEKQLQTILAKGYQVTVAVAEARAMQQVRGPHLVRTDGTVSLGTYGSVYVDDLTIPQARAAIEAHLSQYILNPQISLDVSGYNSKVYYVIFDGGGFGEQVNRLPMTGKTTVLDALALVNGLPIISDKHHLWLARPSPGDQCGEQTMEIDYIGIARRGETATNYQVLPGDRIYVKADPLVSLDTFLARFYSPIERTFGLILLGTTMDQSFRAPGGGTTR
jgi:polysaccharide export outer membrane protein